MPQLGSGGDLVARFGAEGATAETLELVEALRADLDGAGYRVAEVERLWDDLADGTATHPGRVLARGHRVPAALALARGASGFDDARRRLATLAGLFLLGLPAAPDAVGEALPSLGLDGAIRLGLVGLVEPVGMVGPAIPAGAGVEPVDGAIHARFDLRPYAFADAVGDGHWWICSDLGELALGGPLGEEHVLGIGGASTTLSGLLLQQHSRSTLDLGTGSGIQALHAARWSDRVVATDISERALAIARFTAALNGVDRIEFRLGSLYEPVAGARFDRIVSNPPFVITPRAEGVPQYEYRDGGMVGDGIVEAVLRGAAAHLAPGGIAQLLANWEYRGEGETPADGLDRVAGWLDGSGLEHWIVERERQDPSEYAETWIRDCGTRPGTPEFEALHAAWLDDFAARGVTGVGFGYVLLRAPLDGAAPRLRRTERRHGALGDVPGGLGAQFTASLAASDALASLEGEGLRDAVLVVAPDVTEERHHWPGAEQPTVILLRQGGGFGRVVDAGTALAAFVGAADGELPAGILSDAIAQLLEVDAAALWVELAPQLAELVFGGILVLAP